MIIDLIKFINDEKPYWTELETILSRHEKMPHQKMNLDEIKRFHYLYQRASADLAKIMTFSSEQHIRRYLESLIGTAYSEIYEEREKPHRFAPLKWLFIIFPQTFRRHITAFWIALAIFLAGCAFGGLAISFDPASKRVLMPFSHLQGSPSERVAKEEKTEKDHLKGQKASFSSWLMTHNTKVSIFALALGMTWGIGTIILLFSNGVMLGAVILDYILSGESKFLAGWLLPHGSVEIPAILLASQAGLILAGALIGWGIKDDQWKMNSHISLGTFQSSSIRMRLRIISGDLVTLIIGVGIMLVWAGMIEGFFSQYHEPVIPYELKIGFGLIELLGLILFFGRAGRHV